MMSISRQGLPGASRSSGISGVFPDSSGWDGVSGPGVHRRWEEGATKAFKEESSGGWRHPESNRRLAIPHETMIRKLLPDGFDGFMMDVLHKFVEAMGRMFSIIFFPKRLKTWIPFWS
jgi:hypothetical protein